MVLNRIPFLADTDNNKALIGSFIYEVMWELNVCFGLPEEQIGNDDNYNTIQRSIIADITCLYILMMKMLANVGGDASNPGGPVGGKYVSRTKAGSVEVEFKQFDLTKDAGLYSSGTGLFEMFKKSAIRKAAGLGCVIDICDDCSMTIQLLNAVPPPMIVVPDGSCCGGWWRTPPEQG